MRQKVYIFFLLSLIITVVLFSLGCSSIQTVGQAIQMETSQIVRLEISNGYIGTEPFVSEDNREIMENLQPLLMLRVENGKEVCINSKEFKAGEFTGYPRWDIIKSNSASQVIRLYVSPDFSFSKIVIYSYDKSGKQNYKQVEYEIVNKDRQAAYNLMTFWKKQLP